MMEKIKSFIKKPVVWIGALATCVVGVVVTILVKMKDKIKITG